MSPQDEASLLAPITRQPFLSPSDPQKLSSSQIQEPQASPRQHRFTVHTQDFPLMDHGTPFTEESGYLTKPRPENTCHCVLSTSSKSQQHKQHSPQDNQRTSGTQIQFHYKREKSHHLALAEAALHTAQEKAERLLRKCQAAARQAATPRRHGWQRRCRRPSRPGIQGHRLLKIGYFLSFS